MWEPRFSIAVGLIVGTFILDVIVILLLVYHAGFAKDPLAMGIVGSILGAWNAALAGSYNYWLGSSAGSKEKSDQLAEQAKRT